MSRYAAALLALAVALVASPPADASDTSREMEASRRLRERLAARDPSSGRAVREAPSADEPRAALDGQDVGHIVVMEHDGSDYSWKDSEGIPNYEPRALLAQRFYETHGDNYDFLVVFTNFEFDTGEARAFHNLVRNDVSGIGKEQIDNGVFFGSPGRLRGYIDMAALTRYTAPPWDLEPGSPGYYSALGTLAHEVAHQWVAFVRYRDGGGELSPDLLGRDGAHWSYLLDSDASHLYGSEWVQREDGVWEAQRVRETYSPLDLYLMGFLDPADVEPITLLRNPAIDVTRLPLEGDVVDATAETILVQQVQAAEGPRLPDHIASPKEFRLAFVFLTAPGTYPTADELSAVDRLREAFASYFFAMTRGVAVADTTLAELPRVTTAPTPDLERALAWLLGSQATDGSWQDRPATAARDTATAVSALFRAGRLAEAWERGVTWLRGLVPANTDFAARRVPPLVSAGLAIDERDLLRSSLADAAHPGGGFGPAPGYASDPLDTALSLRALRSLEIPSRAVAEGAVESLGRQVTPAGGWPMVPGDEVSTVVTAEVLLALLEWTEIPAAQALVPGALAALEARRNPDGGFGESPSTPYATALTLEALLAARAPETSLNPAVAWLEATQGTDGSWNGNRYDTALVVGALRSSLTPNLVVPVDFMVLEPSDAVEGETVQVSFVVRNSGRGNAAASTVRVYAGAPTLGRVLAETGVAPLADGAESSITLTFSTDDLAGPQSIFVVADALDEVAEAREDDNTAERSLNVLGLLPDLVVRPSGLSVQPYPPVDGEVATVVVQVSNEGEDQSEPAILRLFLGDPRNGGLLLAETTVAALDVGEVVAPSLAWDTTGAAGEHALHVVLDATYRVDESNETNNRAALVVRVEATPTDEPDLEVVSLVADPSEFSAVPQVVAVTARVRNLGRQPVDSRVGLYDTDPPAGAPLAELPVSLGGRASTEVVFSYDVTSAGARTLVAFADPANEIAEPSEENNTARVLLEPGVTSDVEVDVAATVASPTDLVRGETVTVTTRVRNRGTTDLRDVPILLELIEPGSTPELDRRIVNLAPGEQVDLAFTWTTGVVGDPLTLRVNADPLDNLDEEDESNNTALLAVTVRPSPLPNLTVSGADVTLDPDPPLQGAAATVSVVVRNPGGVPAAAFDVEVFRGDPALEGVLVGSARVAGLGAAASVTVPVTWSPVDTRGLLGLFVRADGGNEIEEFDETDNLAFRPLSIVGLPDLVLTAAGVSFDPAFPRAGEVVEVRFGVRNFGDRPAVEGRWRALEGEPGVVVGEGLLPALGPGEGADLSFSWTPAAPPGDRRLEILADPDDEIAEADEGNNLARRTVVAQDGDLFVNPPFFSPDGDGVQDQTVLAYRATGAETVDVVVSNARGQEVFRLLENAPPSGTVEWAGRLPDGRPAADGAYTLSLLGAEGALLGRAIVVLDLNLVPIHEAAGTRNTATQLMTCEFPSHQGPAFLPSEDETLFILGDSGLVDLPPGLIRMGLDGDYSYLFEDAWYDDVRFAGRAAVSPNGREVLVVRYEDQVLWAVDLLSGDRRSILPLEGPEYWDGEAVWSPDGRFISTGQRVVTREGADEVRLPQIGYYGNWAWSPDSRFLARFNTVVSRDLSETRSWDVGVPEWLLDYAPIETQWLPDGRIFGMVGADEEEADQPAATEADAPEYEEVCAGNQCAFMIDPSTDAVTPLRWLAERAFSRMYDPARPRLANWSPVGDRVLYHRYPYSSSQYLEKADVAFESGLGPRRLAAQVLAVSPRSSAAHYSGYRGSTDGIPSSCESGYHSVVLRNLENITAELRVARLPGNAGLMLRGIAADRYLDYWQIEYARAEEPEVWHPLGPAFDVPVRDEEFGAWVPPSPGTYALRLTVRDKAGNVRSKARVVTWERFPVISSLSQTEFLISPNSDGVRDDVTFSYVVQEPTRVDVEVRGPRAEPGAPLPLVRRFAFEHPEIGGQSFTWDGRDAASQVVPDGRYDVLVNGIPLFVEVDATPPEVAWAWEDFGLRSVPFGQGRAGVVDAERVWHVWDANLDSWAAVFEPGDVPFQEDTQPRYEPERDAEGEIVYEEDGLPRVKRVGNRVVSLREREPSVESFGVHPAARLRAVDLAGNVSDIPLAPVDEGLFLTTAWEPRPPGPGIPRIWPPFDPDDPKPLPVRTDFSLSETIRDTPDDGEEVRFEVQPLTGGLWAEATTTRMWSVDKLRTNLLGLGLLPGGEYRGRFACDDDGIDRFSDTFAFQVCSPWMRLGLVVPGPGAPEEQFLIQTRSPDAAVGAVFTVWTQDAQTGQVRVALRAGGLPASDLPTRPTGEGGFAFDLPADLVEGYCRIDASVTMASGEVFAPGSEPAECLELAFGACEGPPQPRGSRVTIGQTRVCKGSSPDTLVLRMENAGGPTTATLVGDPDGAAFTITEVELPAGASRLVEVDVSGRPEGPLDIEARDPEGRVLFRLTTVVDRTPPVVEILQPPVDGDRPCLEPHPVTGKETLPITVRVGDSAPTVEVTAEYRLTESTGPWLRLRGACADPPCLALSIRTDLPVSTLWDVTPLADGDYTIRISACDGRGNTGVGERRVILDRDGPHLELIGVDRRAFSPNNDGRAETVTATFEIFEPLVVSAWVEGGGGGLPVRTLFEGRTMAAGAIPLTWDGRDEVGEVAPDGIYRIKLLGDNPCGRPATIVARFELDTRPPDVEIASPVPGATVIGSLDVDGVAFDRNMRAWTLDVRPVTVGDGNIATDGHSVGEPGRPRRLGPWTTPVDAGPYQLVLRAEDEAENEAEVAVPVTVGPRNRIDRLGVQPALFSPNGDGRRETTTIAYGLLFEAVVTLEITDGSTVVRSFVSAVEQPSGDYSLDWDGRDDLGEPAPDGVYRVVLTAADPGGVGPEDRTDVGVEIDREPPEIEVTRPEADAYLDRIDAVVGSVSDLNLAGWTVVAAPGGGGAVPLGEGADTRTEEALAGLEALADGPHALTVGATDAAENESRQDVAFTVDSIPPAVLISAPAPGSVWPTSEPIAVTGNATDVNLVEWVLSFGPGPDPSTLVELARSTEGGVDLALASWDVSSVPDDDYTLVLHAIDRAGHEAEARVTVAVDGTPPVAVIDRPLEAGYVTTPQAVLGSARDAHLESWTLEIAAGPAASAVAFGPLSDGEAEVAGGALGDLDPLPPDGVHTLRLTVRDRAGHVSEALRTITVDTTPPAPPQPRARVVPKTLTRADVVVEWDPNTEPDLAGYRLARDGFPQTTLFPDPTHTDPGRLDGVYRYDVTAEDLAGNVSEPGTVTVKVDLTPPQVDILLPEAGASVSGSVDIKGTAWSADDFAEYRLYVGAGTAPGAWTLVRRSTLPVLGGLLGTWTALGEGPWVIALEAEDTSGNSNRTESPVVVDNRPPTPPVLLSVEVDGAPTDLRSTWQPSPDPDVTGYLLYRNGSLANGPGLLLGSLEPFLLPPPDYVDPGLPDGRHCYHVEAMDEAGNTSAPSNEICRDLDNRPPRAVIVDPPDGRKFEFPIRIIAFTEDLDVASVQFQITPEGLGLWEDLGPADTTEPWETTLDPQPLDFGRYELRAEATDTGPPPKTDPAPPAIIVVYGDTTAPGVPIDLQARVDGRSIRLTWAANTEVDLAGYLLSRDGTPVGGTITTTEYTDDRPPGTYSYTVVAVDGDDNESGSSDPAEAVVYAVALDHVFPVATQPELPLTGSGSRPDTTVSLLREAVPVSAVPAAGSSFLFPDTALSPGLNTFSARGEDAEGNRSIVSDDLLLILDDPPGPVTGLGAVSGPDDVTLSWDAAVEPDVVGHRVRRDGEVVTGSAPQTTAQSILASSSRSSFYLPNRAFDGSTSTVWAPRSTDSQPWWEIRFPEAVSVDEVRIRFSYYWGSARAVTGYRIEARWEGSYLPLVVVRDNIYASTVVHELPGPFTTDGLRVVLVDRVSTSLGIAEVGIQRTDFATSGWADTAGLKDGDHEYEVAAVDRYGLEGPFTSVTAPVDRLSRPTGLVGVPEGSDAVLTWNPNPEPDIDHYNVFRDGAFIGTAPTPAYRDPDLPNAEYVYTVSAVDADDNESEESDPATVVISLVPQAPVLRATATPLGFVDLDWDHPGAPVYVLYRSTTSGGPFTLLAEVPGQSFTDRGVVLGVEHFYVVVARDGLGNPSPTSNEASATPERTDPLMAPVILFPTDAARPITLALSQTRVRGRAELAVSVRLTVDGVPRPLVETVGLFEAQGHTPLSPDLGRALLGPDGRRLVMADYDETFSRTTLQVLDQATGRLSVLPQGPYLTLLPVSFAPDGTRVLAMGFATEADPDVQDLVIVDLLTGAHTDVEVGPTRPIGGTWSPEGQRVAYGPWPGTVCTLYVRDLVAGVTTPLDIGGCPQTPTWSPVDDRIAALVYGEGLRVVEADGASLPVLVDPEAAGAASWSPDGSALAYPAGPSSVLRIMDIGTGVPTDLTTTPVREAFFDPTGRWVSYWQDGPDGGRVVAVDPQTTEEAEVGTGLDDVGLHGWTSQGYVSTSDGETLTVHPGFEGAFELLDVPLLGGENELRARSLIPGAGLEGPESEAVTITVLEADLELLESDLRVDPLVPLVGQPARLLARVRNVGGFEARDFAVGVTLFDPVGGVAVDDLRTVGTLGPGAVETLVIDFVPTVPGRYGLAGEVDVDGVVAEAREDNNAAARRVDVALVPGLLATVESDRSEYPSHSTALVSLRVINAGEPFTGSARTTVEDGSGHVVATLDVRNVSLAYGQSAVWDLRWDTGAVYAGDYFFRLRVSDAAEAESAAAEKAFRILPELQARARLTPDSAVVPEHAPAVFRAVVVNGSPNSPLQGATARFSIVAAGTPGPALFETTALLPGLLPGGEWTGVFTWPDATPDGDHLAVLEVLGGASLLSTASAPFEVTAAAGRLTGSIVALPDHILEGDPFEARVEVANVGQAPLAAHPAVVEIVSGPDATVHRSEPLTLDIEPGQTLTQDVPMVSLGLAPGQYSVRLRAGDPAATLARTPLRIHGLITPPSPDAPPDESRVDTPHPVLSVNNATSSEGAPLSYAFEIYADETLTTLLPGVAGVEETPARTAWRVAAELVEDNRYWWRARATDGFSTSGWTDVWSFLVDAVNEPPSVPQPESPVLSDRVASLQPPLVARNSFDPENDALTYDYRLGREPDFLTVLASTNGVAEGEDLTTWPLPLVLEENETYCWAARANDGQNLSPWSGASCFLVDLQDEPPTAPTPIRPIGGVTVVTITPDLVVGPAVDPEGLPLTYGFEIDTTGSFDSPERQASPERPDGGAETAWVPPVPLRDNTLYHWRAAASDGSQRGPWARETFFVNFGNDPPTVPVLLDPVGGSAVATFTPTLRLRNAVDPDLEALVYDFEVIDDIGATVDSVEGVPETPAETEWTLSVPLEEGRVYEWRARARDAEVGSEWAAWESFRVRVAPTAPGLIAPAEGEVVGTRQPALVVSNATSPRDLPLTYSFELYSEGPGGPTPVDSVDGVPEGVSSTSWTSALALADGEYSWRARAIDGTLFGPWMATARFSVSVDEPPAPPTGLTATAGDGLVELEWDASPEPDVVGYRLYRSLSPGGPYDFLVETVDPEHVDTGLTNGTTYHYVVTALDAQFESDPSGEASATPQGSTTVVPVEAWLKPRTLAIECLLNRGCRGGSHGCLRAGHAGHDLVQELPADERVIREILGDPVADGQGWGGSCGHHDRSADDRSHRCGSKCGPTEPEVDCPTQVRLFIEPPAGYRAADIDPASVRLGGSVVPRRNRYKLVDSDRDGVEELRLRFQLESVLPLLQPGSNTLAVTGLIGGVPFEGEATLEVLPPKVNVKVEPRVLKPRHRCGGHSQHKVTAELRVPDCMDARDIDVDSIRLNGTVPVRKVIKRRHGRLEVSFDRSQVLAVLPPGCDVEVTVSGTIMGVPFEATDVIEVRE